MILPGYCQTMARYNAWQNREIWRIVQPMSPADLRAERGAFFGSILGTLNHTLWGDMLWMSRFDGGAGAPVTLSESPEMTPTAAAWWAERFRTDGRIKLWAAQLDAVDLVGELTWYSAALDRHFTKPRALCVMQMFNHQTHHRGQVHAMLTAAGQQTQITDLPFLPEDN